MFPDNYRWHCDYVRLAWDSGFSFGCYYSNYSNFDKNNLVLVDIEQLIRERDIASVERHIPTVLQYALENNHAEILDVTFVKVFRISQLAVEYLLFCKRYLDNLVVSLKSDNSKLKDEIEDLKLEIETLERTNLISTFKCEKCPKAFSNPEYLDSHIKRRHIDEKKMITDSETNKLHMEIKELKERLNITEKLLQEKNNSEIHVDFEKNDIREKFENFKKQVENELAIMRAEKSFYQGKYDKMFDMVLESGHKRQHLLNMATQTEELIEDVEEKQKTEIVSYQEEIMKQDIIAEKIEEKINTFSENIDVKISVSLQNIQDQMHDFWEKLQSLDAPQPQIRLTNTEVQTQEERVKPQIKPRTKFSISSEVKESKIEMEKLRSEAENMRKELEKLQQNRPEVKVVHSETEKTKKVEKLKENKPEIKPIQIVESKRKDIYEPEKMKIKTGNKKFVKKSPKKRKRKKGNFVDEVNIILKYIGSDKKFSNKTLQKALKVMYSKENDKEQTNIIKASTVTIKNRSIYDTTDSERDIKVLVDKSKRTQSNTDSDFTSAMLTDDEREIHVKSVLKNSHPEEVLIKKRVLFDIKNCATSNLELSDISQTE